MPPTRATIIMAPTIFRWTFTRAARGGDLHQRQAFASISIRVHVLQCFARCTLHAFPLETCSPAAAIASPAVICNTIHFAAADRRSKGVYIGPTIRSDPIPAASNAFFSSFASRLGPRSAH